MKKMNHSKYQKQLKNKSMAQLMYIINDAKATLEAWPNHPNHGYYTDEIHYAAMEIKARRS